MRRGGLPLGAAGNGAPGLYGEAFRDERFEEWGEVRAAAFLVVAQEALGHNSKAVHRAYAKRALMKLPSLEEYEQRAAAKLEPAT